MQCIWPIPVYNPNPNALLLPYPKLCFLHASGAIDANDLAVDPLAVLGREEANDAGNVDGETDAVEGRPGGSVLDRLC